MSMDSFSLSATLATAYFYLAVQKLFQLPSFVYVMIFFIASVLATATALTPIQLSKYRLASSHQSIEDYARFLTATQASGNDVIAQSLYRSMQPLITKQPLWIQHDLHEMVYPQERIALLMKFWNMVAAQQPNAREVNAALTILSYQTFDQKKFEQYLQHWKQLEPNDVRLSTFTITEPHDSR